MKPNMDFIFTSPISVQESEGKTLISGTLICEGISRNGNQYTLPILRSIAQQSVGKPLIYGVDEHGKHLTHGETVGKIIKTVFDKLAKKVRFIAEVTSNWLKNAIKPYDFGVSIDGQTTDVDVVQKFGKAILRLKDIIIKHIQIVPLKFAKLGIPEATISDVRHVTETMTFMTSRKRILTENQVLDLVAGLIQQKVIAIE